MWIDQCFGQFKSAWVWYFVSRYPNLTAFSDHLGGCQSIWNIFAIGHGKGEVDGTRVLLKWEIKKEYIKPRGMKIQDVAKVMAYLKFEANKFHVAHPHAQQHINKFFYKVKVGDIDRSRTYECEIVMGNKVKHQVQSLSTKDPTICQYCQLSYFCVNYFDKNPKVECINKDHVLEWTLAHLRPRNGLEV